MNDNAGPVPEDAGNIVGMLLVLCTLHDGIENEPWIWQSTLAQNCGVHGPGVRTAGGPKLGKHNILGPSAFTVPISRPMER